MNKPCCWAMCILLAGATAVHAQPQVMPSADAVPQPATRFGGPAALGTPIPTMPTAIDAPTVLPDRIPARLPPTLPGMPIMRLNIPLPSDEPAAQPAGGGKSDSPARPAPMPSAVATTPAPIAAAPVVRTDAPAAPANRAWLGVDYLLWWVRSGPTGGPLLTAGSPTDLVPGALGQPGTRVLLGDAPLNYGVFSGLRINGGLALGSALSLEGSYLVLEQRSASFFAGSNAAGTPLIARPIIDAMAGMQGSYVDSFPGFLAGSFQMQSRTQLQGYELNLATSADRGAVRLGVLGGLRILTLSETMTLSESLTPLAAGVLNFNGPAIGIPSQVTDFDQFRTGNQFYGGQVGGRIAWQGPMFTVSAVAKVALGATQETVRIDGASNLFMPGASPVIAPGGVLAQTSNIGNHFRSTFAVVPEAGLEIGYQITPRLRATLGYTFLYWSAVARPGNQIDRTVNPALVPTDPAFATPGGAARPGLPTIRESDFWAQGINLGLVFGF